MYTRRSPFVQGIIDFFKLFGVIGIIVGTILLIGFAIALPTIAVFGVWNWFVVVQFGLKPIGWIVSFLIAVILGIVFRGIVVRK
jgi:hypothetical protein